MARPRFAPSRPRCSEMSPLAIPDDYSLAELCISAASEAWRDDGEVLATGIGLIPRLAASLAKLTINRDLLMNDGEATPSAGALFFRLRNRDGSALRRGTGSGETKGAHSMVVRCWAGALGLSGAWGAHALRLRYRGYSAITFFLGNNSGIDSLGRAVRDSILDEITGLHVCSRAHARARHRSEHSDLQSGQCGAAACAGACRGPE